MLAVAFSPESQAIASSSVDQIQIWEVATGRVLRSLGAHTGWIRSLAWSLDGTLLASSSHDSTVRLLGAIAPGLTCQFIEDEM